MSTFSGSRLRCLRPLNLVAMVCIFMLTLFMLNYGFGGASSSVAIGNPSPDGSTTSPLDVFQIQAPLRKSYEGASCQQVVVQHNFAASYGTPYIGEDPQPTSQIDRRLIRIQEHTHHPKIATSPPPSSTYQSLQLELIMTDLASYSLGISKYGGPPRQCLSELAFSGISKRT